jgi:hypothetical protein
MFSNKMIENTNKETPIKADNFKDKKGIFRKYSVLVKSVQKKASFYLKHNPEKQLTKSIQESDKVDPENNRQNQVNVISDKIPNSSTNENILNLNNSYEDNKKILEGNKSFETQVDVQPFSLPVKKEIKIVSNGLFENIIFPDKKSKVLSIFSISR